MNQALQEKVSGAIASIEKILGAYRNPCLLCSFGKDSVVLLHLMKQEMGIDIPIVFFKQAFFPRKYDYANRLIAEWDLNVFSDVPPIGYTMTKGNNILEIVSHYPFGGDKWIMLPVGWIDHEKSPHKWLCGRDDILGRPFGGFNWPWDVAFMGHKGGDKDAVQGDVFLKVDVHQNNGGCHTAYPLRRFTDSDIWECIEGWKIPVHHERYEKVDGKWATKPDKLFDPDYFPYCTKCLDRDGPVAVACPKTGLEITNIGPGLQYLNHKETLKYMGDK